MPFGAVRKAYNYLKRNGIEETFYASLERITDKSEYKYVPIDDATKALQRKRKWKTGRLFSIVVPTYETKEVFLRELIESVISQTYSNWELILSDASKTDSVRKIAESYGDARIRYIKLRENKGISINTNAGIQVAHGDYIGLLDHDDTITSDALYEFASKLESGDENGIEYAYIFSDEDKCNTDATEFFEPNYKPGFNLDLLLSNNYICHFLMLKGELMKELMLRSDYDGAQDHDLVLRAFAKTYSTSSDKEVAYGHVAKVLYHWRCHEASTASNPESKRYAYEAGKRAVEDYLKQAGIAGKVSHTKHNGFYRVDYVDNLIYPAGGQQLKRKNELTATKRGEMAYNMFLNRYDIGAIGGPVINGNKITGGAIDYSKTCPYDGLNVKFSGYMHRASMQQDVMAVDIRNMVIAEGLCDGLISVAESNEHAYLFNRELISALKETITSGKLNAPYIDVTALLSDVKYEDYEYMLASMAVCKEIAMEGYLSYYDPQFVDEK